MREREFLNWIIAVAEQFGWQCYHVPAPMTAARGGGFVGAKRAAGLPDLFLLHDDPPRMIIAEVKGPNGKLSDRQQKFLRLARGVADVSLDVSGDRRFRRNDSSSVGVYAWTPADESIIEQMLRSKILL